MRRFHQSADWIENDKSDIQLETLQKIVELGIGEKIIVQIKSGKAAKRGHSVQNKVKEYAVDI